MRVLVQPDKLELLDEAKQRWISLEGKWHAAKNGTLNIIDQNLDEKIGAGTVKSGDYSALRVSFKADSQIEFAKSAAACPPQKKSEKKCPVTGWESKPLLGGLGESEISVVIPGITHIAEKTTTEIILEIDPFGSVTADNDKYYFKPIMRVKNLVSPAYHNPELPAVTQSADATVKAEFPEFAVTEPKNFSIQKIEPGSLGANLPLKTKLINAYQFLPDTVFDKPVRLTFTYDPLHINSIGVSPAQLRVQYLHKHKNAWFEIPVQQINTADHTITVYTNHFTIIAISGGTGFRLTHETGVAGRIHYNFLKYYAQKLFPVKIPEFMASVNTTGLQTPFTNGPVSGFTKTDVQQRNLLNADFEIDVKPHDTAPNKLVFELKLKEPLNFGKVQYDYTAAPNGYCHEEFNKCSAHCGGSWFTGDWCRATKCHVEAYTCAVKQNFFSGTSSSSLDYTLKSAKIGLVFRVQQDSETGIVRFTYLPAESIVPADKKWISLEGRVVSHTNPGGMAAIQLMLVNAYMDTFVHAIANTAVNDTMGELADQLNQTFADFTTSPGQTIALDTNGLVFSQKMVLDFENIPNQNFQCSTPVNIPIPDNVTPGVLTLPAHSHFGTGFSLNAFEQILAEIANRGYLCYTGPVGMSGDFLQITPASGISLDYGGGYVLKVKIPVSLVYTPFAQAPRSDNGAISFRYRIKPGIAMRNLGLEFLGIEHSFTDVELATALDLYQTTLLNFKTSNPEAFGFTFDFPEPVSFAGLQPSMYRLQNLDKNNGLLLFDYKIQGLLTDYQLTGKNSEWVWTKDWESKTNECRPHLAGTLRSSSLDFSSGQLNLLNTGIPQVIFDYFLNQPVQLQGRCESQVFHAENLLDDLFLFAENNTLSRKAGYVPQLVAQNYADTTGLYSLNITGDATPELLQIRKLATPSTTMTWYLNKDCCQGSYGDTPKDTIALPAVHETEGLYKILVVKPPAGYDRIRINEKEYTVQVSGTSVTLVEYLPIRDLVIENASFELPFTWDYLADGFQGPIVPGGHDGNFSLQLGDGSSHREPGSGRGHLKAEDHEVGGKYTVSFYYKTKGPETYLGPDPNMECPVVCNPPPFKGCWRPSCVPGDVPLPAQHSLAANLVVFDQGGSCVYGIGNITSANTYRIDIPWPLPLTNDTWQKIEQEFQIPPGKCGLNIDFMGVTHTTLQLDNFRVVWEKL